MGETCLVRVSLLEGMTGEGECGEDMTGKGECGET